MKFKVEITDEYTKIMGSTKDILVGLTDYIDALKQNQIPIFLIKMVVEAALKEDCIDGKNKIDNIKVHKIDLSNLSKEEAKKILDKEIFDKLFD